MKDNTLAGKIFNIVNNLILFIFATAAVLPFLYIAAGSLTAQELPAKDVLLLFPTKFSLDSYIYLFTTNALLRSLYITFFITIVGTIFNLFFTSLMAYPLSNENLIGRRPITFSIVFTMLFSGGMIPNFLVVKYLGLINSLWSQIIPDSINTFYLIILRNFFQQLPRETVESARIDGCSEIKILYSIILPLSKPSIAALTFFYLVGHWNTYMSAILYINDARLWPVQVILRQIITMSQAGIGDTASIQSHFILSSQSVIMAAICVAIVPLLCIYPFLQKYFVKGTLLGKVKG